MATLPKAIYTFNETCTNLPTWLLTKIENDLEVHMEAQKPQYYQNNQEHLKNRVRYLHPLLQFRAESYFNKYGIVPA